MLSPCTRQVTHALLTRPPLSYKSLGFIITPFDLHVLSTPPAFILSQDQTLELKVFSSFIKTLALIKPDFCSRFPQEIVFRFRNGIFLPDCSLELCCKKFSGLHYCLSVLSNKSFSRFISHSKHRFYGLFAYLLFLKNLKPFTRDLLIIANTFVDVNGFFQKFSTFFLNVFFWLLCKPL